MDETSELAAKRFSIIIEEALSRQNKETESKMNWVIGQPDKIDRNSRLVAPKGLITNYLIQDSDALLIYNI
jgi:hypothetical protein